MKHLCLFPLLALALVVGFAGSSSAAPINISIDPTTLQQAGDIDKGILGNNSPATNFDFLLQQIDLYNNSPTPGAHDLPAPVFTGHQNAGGNTVSVTGFDYAVLHYGKGPGGTGQGGGIEFFYLNGMTGTFTFSSDGLGPNGRGGFSSIRLFTSSPSTPSNGVPDGGSTLILLGAALAGIAFFTRLAGHTPAIVRP